MSKQLEFHTNNLEKSSFCAGKLNLFKRLMKLSRSIKKESNLNMATPRKLVTKIFKVTFNL